jgi:hypothetical protein
MKKWPEHYPEQCPPPSAIPPSGNVFRFTVRTSPKERDFLSYYELKPDEKWGNKACIARGLSVYTSIDDCIAAAAAVPALKKKKISVALLPANSGVIASTPSMNIKNHRTFWPVLEAKELAKLFSPRVSVGVGNV